MDDPVLKEDVATILVGKMCLSEGTLATPAWVDSFLQMAAEAAAKAEAKANAAAAGRFEDWGKEGPAAGLKRQHLCSRNATGWIPDKCGETEKVKLSELD